MKPGILIVSSETLDEQDVYSGGVRLGHVRRDPLTGNWMAIDRAGHLHGDTWLSRWYAAEAMQRGMGACGCTARRVTCPYCEKPLVGPENGAQSCPCGRSRMVTDVGPISPRVWETGGRI